MKTAEVTEAPARFICKRCGAESPAGIGYVVGGSGPLPKPTDGCPNYHHGESVDFNNPKKEEVS